MAWYDTKLSNYHQKSFNKTFLAATIIILTCIKLLLIPSYLSTDFDVHRNWLSITRNLPLSEWYFDDIQQTTVHTLDYPPLFAFFEAFWSSRYNPLTNWFLENQLVDSRCFERLPDNDNTPSEACVFFQRITVVLSDLIFIIGAYFASFCLHSRTETNVTQDGPISPRQFKHLENGVISTLLIIFNPGILMLDHVHFQYNGMLLGLLLFSIGFMIRGSTSQSISSPRISNDIMAAITFALLLTMKHLYLTLAPLYFVYLLRHFCFRINQRQIQTRGKNTSNKKTQEKQANKMNFELNIGGFLKLAICTLASLSLPFLPFLIRPDASSQLTQILKRLFPFSRGLCHDYWAANVWALYLFAEKCISFVLKKICGIQEFQFLEISPLMAAISLLISLIPSLLYAWDAAGSFLKAACVNNSKSSFSKSVLGKSFFIYAVIYSSFCSFMLAYHVHEKAIMTAIIPMTLVAPLSRKNAQLYLRSSTLGHFALLPLLYQHTELIMKISCFIAHFSLSVFLLEYIVVENEQALQQTEYSNSMNQTKKSLLTKWDKMGLFVMAILVLFTEIIHPIWFKPKQMLEFLPLMMISVFCAVGLIGCYIHTGFILRECTQCLIKSST